MGAGAVETLAVETLAPEVQVEVEAEVVMVAVMVETAEGGGVGEEAAAAVITAVGATMVLLNGLNCPVNVHWKMQI